MNSRNWKHIWIYFAIPAVMLLYYNKSANWHYHLTENGLLIEHAHPFTPSNSNKPYQDHEHTDAELLFFAQITHLTELLIIFVITLGLFLKSQQLQLKQYTSHHIPYPLTGSIITRGPPKH